MDLVQAEKRGGVACPRGFAARRHDDDDHLKAREVQVGCVLVPIVFCCVVVFAANILPILMEEIYYSGGAKHFRV